jgi:hypothetical protein
MSLPGRAIRQSEMAHQATSDTSAIADTPEVRDRLHEAWRSVASRIVAAGMPRGATMQTMVTIAAEEFARTYGPDLAAEYFAAISSAFRNPVSGWKGMADSEAAVLARLRSRRSAWHLPRSLVSKGALFRWFRRALPLRVDPLRDLIEIAGHSSRHQGGLGRR